MIDPRENGCWRHPDCETCPFTDCIADVSEIKPRLLAKEDIYYKYHDLEAIAENNRNKSLSAYYKLKAEHKCYKCKKIMPLTWDKVYCPECREKFLIKKTPQNIGIKQNIQKQPQCAQIQEEQNIDVDLWRNNLMQLVKNVIRR